MIEVALWETAVDLHNYLESCNYSFCVIGGIALQRWGEPRVTQDVDVTLIVQFGNERQIAEEILKRYQSRVSNPLEFALQARILLLKDLMGNKIDLALGGLPYEERCIERSKIISLQSASISGSNGSLRLISFFVFFEYFVVGICFTMERNGLAILQSVISQQSRNDN